MKCLKRLLHFFKIIAFLQYFKDNDDMRQFSINVAADIFVEMLENDKELKDKIISNFKI